MPEYITESEAEARGWDTRKPPGMGRRMAAFRPDHKSFGAFILSDQMRDATAEVAQDVATTARGLTPRGQRTRGTHMADRYTVKRDGGKIKVDRAFRVMVLVENDDPSSAAVEFGNKRARRQRPLGRAGAQYGDMHSKSEGF